jgi:sporulation protein YlmC with PRC-barrel domain
MDNETIPIAIELAENWAIRSLYCIEFCLFLFAISPCLYLVKLLNRSNFLHVNLRLLLGNLAIAYVGMAVSRIVDITRVIVLVVNPNNKLGLMQDQVFCQAIKIPYDCVLTVAAFTLIMLAIERMVATVKARVYETKKSAKLGISLLVILVRHVLLYLLVK